MARAETVTQLSLDRFAEIIGYNPLHFNQVTSELAQVRTCGQPILQYSWQSAHRVSREDMALAIYAAEQQIIGWTGFDLKPLWNADERHLVRGSASLIHSDKRKVITGGQRAISFVSNAGVAYTDNDGDAYAETATITVATTVTDSEELQIYYPGQSAADEWRIDTTRKSINAGIATITTRRERLVKPELMSRLEVENVDGDDNANFLTTVDVYREYNDPSKQVDFVLNSCCATGCQACNYTLQSGCISILNDSFLRMTPANYVDGNYVSALCSTGYYDRVRLWYKAGLRSTVFEQATAYLALTLLDRPLCSCNNIEHVTQYWSLDMAGRRPGGVFYNLSKGILDCPFGTSRGGIFAWRAIKDA